FPQKVLDRCLAKPTAVGFAMGHAGVVSKLVEHNSKLIDFSGCKEVLQQLHDTRTLYALSALQWDRPWSEIKNAIFDCLFSEEPYVRLQAQTTVLEKAKVNELRAFTKARGISLSTEAEICQDLSTFLIYLSKH